MIAERRINRVYDFRQPEPMRVEIHEHDCPCCAPVEEAEALTFSDLGKLAWWGMIAGTAIAFCLDAHSAVTALRSVVGL